MELPVNWIQALCRDYRKLNREAGLTSKDVAIAVTGTFSPCENALLANWALLVAFNMAGSIPQEHLSAAFINRNVICRSLLQNGVAVVTSGERGIKDFSTNRQVLHPVLAREVHRLVLGATRGLRGTTASGLLPELDSSSNATSRRPDCWSMVADFGDSQCLRNFL